LDGMDIYVKSGHVVDPYFHLSMLSSMNRWRKVWFFFKNDADAPLPVLMSIRPVPQPNWGYGVARRDLHRLQPLCEVVQQLRREWADELGPSTDLFQPPGSTTAPTGDGHVDVSRAKFSRLFLLRGVGRCRDQHSYPQGPSSWGRPESWGQPRPLKRRG
jgi:hypothetical protein